MQKIDTGRVYAMKTLQKAEMLKRDQVRVLSFVHCYSRLLQGSSRTSAQSATSLPSQRRLGSCNCTIRFKILYICT